MFPVADGHSFRMAVGQALSHWLEHLPVPWTSKSVCSCHKCFWLFTSFWSCRHLTGNWRRLGADPPLPGNCSWSPSRRDGGWGLLYPHSRRNVSTKITHFLLKQEWPTHESLVFSVYTHFISPFHCLSTQYSVLASHCGYVVSLLTGSNSTDLRRRSVVQTLCMWPFKPASQCTRRSVSLDECFVFGGRLPKYANIQKKAEHVSQNNHFWKLMLTVISHGDLCKFKSSVDSLAGPKHVVKCACQLYQFMCN